MTQRLMPPASGLSPTITVNGRTYTCALGSTVDVPDADAPIMTANGWVNTSGAGVGPTSSRPLTPSKGHNYNDTTLGYVIRFDGLVWRNPNTGAAV